MISQTAEYALRAIVHLAGNPEVPHTTREIAAATLVSPPYLSKVMQSLARAGLVVPQRGLHGGFTLKRRPEAVTIFEVIQAVDPIQRIEGCPLGLLAHGTHLCPLHRRLDEAIRLVQQSFEASTVADLLTEPTDSKPLCPFPMRAPVAQTTE